MVNKKFQVKYRHFGTPIPTFHTILMEKENEQAVWDHFANISEEFDQVSVKEVKDNICEADLPPNKVWVGNHDVTNTKNLPDHLKQLKTAKLGAQAYDIKGELIPTNEMLPLIIDKSEVDLYDKIMMARMKEAMR